jgi:hypothetical protein
MTIGWFLLSWAVSGGVLGVIMFLLEDTATTLGDLIMMIFLFVLFGWIGVGASILYSIGSGCSWLIDSGVFKIELKKREKGDDQIS